jgi:iron complex transport system ATP-binding protein
VTLHARALSVRIGVNLLLDRVELDLRPGELLAVVGPNGAGKSTLLATLSGERRPSSGEVTLDGTALSRFKPLELARRRAVLPQESSLEFDFTALEVTLLGRMPFTGGRESPRDIEIARAALRLADAAHLETRRYPTLSGGERGRVQLARVLAQIWHEATPTRDRYLLLDEPTSSLDLAHQHGTLAVAKGLALEGVGVLAVLHDLNLAAAYADRVAVLQRGALVALGAPRAVLTSSLLEHTFGLRVAVTEANGVVTVSAGQLEPKRRTGGDIAAL